MADWAIVFAGVAPEAKGISMFIVDMKLPGVSCGSPEKKMGITPATWCWKTYTSLGTAWWVRCTEALPTP